MFILGFLNNFSPPPFSLHPRSSWQYEEPPSSDQIQVPSLIQGTGDTTDDWGDFGEMDDAMMLVEAAEEAEMSIKNKGTDDVKGKASIFDSKDEPSYVSWRQLEAPEVKHGMSEDSSLQGSMTLQASPSSTSIPTSASSSVLLEKDGTLRMFWMDAYERQGLVWLFGKVFHRESGQWMSTCVTIQGSLRNLYVLPQPAQYNGKARINVYDEWEKRV